MVRSLASKQNEFMLESANMDFTDISSHFMNFWIIFFFNGKKGNRLCFLAILVVNIFL